MPLHFVSLSCDNVVLITAVKLDEISRPSPNSDDKLLMRLGILLRVKHRIKADGVELYLMSSAVNIMLNELCRFCAERGIQYSNVADSGDKDI